MSMQRSTSEALDFRHARRTLQAGEPIPAMPSLLDQIAQINAMALIAKADGAAHNDDWAAVDAPSSNDDSDGDID
jgi:hypothetical protein